MIPFASQVNRFSRSNKLSIFFKSHRVPAKVYPLRNRGLVEVSGPEAAQFLQGLVTNDMNHFEKGAKSLYAMFLNDKGKVLYDTLVHKWGYKTDDVFMLECDKGIHRLLQQHLKMYKFKRNVNVEDVSKLYKLWAFIAPSDFDKDFYETIAEHNISVYKDPRLADLGHRLITIPEIDHLSIREAMGQETVIEVDEQEYVAMRYKLGVSEGAADIFPGTCCPLEANCDYLNGLSFEKVYYIGQESITPCISQAVRERIMPIQFLRLEIDRKEDLEQDAKIWANRDCGQQNVGKFKNYLGRVGLGLIKITEALKAKSLHIGSNPVVISQPHWWPKEILIKK